MKLEELLKGLSYTCEKRIGEAEITDIIYDSRKVEKGCLFVCMTGAKFDAHICAKEAIEKGARAVLVEHRIEEELYQENIIIEVENTRKALAVLSAAYFNYPSKQMTTIAITGTKGKTTTAYMTKAILEKAGKSVGIIGTIGAFYKDIKIETKNTTPESYELQKILRQMADENITHVVMEVSSQAFKSFRVEGMEFDYGVFTNISPDHIGEGEHKDFEEYLSCKSQLFQHCRIGILNQDDEKWKEILKNHTCEEKTFSLLSEGEEGTAILKGRDIKCIREPEFIGISFHISGGYEMDLKVGCMGRFNAYNALAAISVAYLEGIKEEDVKEAMYYIAVRGRVEPVYISDKVHLIIDYAHNAVSAESLLTTILEYEPGRLVCVFGAGGNRSKLRRYDMGEIAGKYADISILTADNPRFEEVEDIIADIKIGMEKSHGKYIEIPNRKEAIRYSIEHAQDGDIIVLFGKGHEDYQEIKGVRYPFDERVVIKEILEELHIK